MNIGKKMTDHQTKSTLLNALMTAAQRGLTVDEIKMQRLSYVMSTLKESDTETKERVEKVLESI